MRRRETVTFTREQLYELVWSKPMTEIAAEFGMSSVAFAKHCATADVPRPGRGFWQQLQHGQKPSREGLPTRPPEVPETVSIDKYDRPSLRRRAPDQRPHVTVPARITRYHPVVKELDALLRPDVHHQGFPAVRGYHQTIMKVSEESRRRTLRLLHALFVAVEAQGHQVRLTKGPDGYRGEQRPRALEIVIDGEPATLSLREHLNQRPHQVSEREKKWSFFARKYDLVPSGELVLELHVPWGADTKTRWRDGENGRLEDLLGEIVWAIGEAAKSLAAHRARIAEEQRQAEVARKAAEEKACEQRQRDEEERRRKEQEEREVAHRKWLHDDLLRMANDWRQADAARGFLAAVASRVPKRARTPEFSGWFTWAKKHVELLDPMNAVGEIAKPLAPPEQTDR